MARKKTEYDDRKSYNTTLQVSLMRDLRVLAAKLDKRQNDLIEEAIRDLLDKYKMEAPAKMQPQQESESASISLHEDIEEYIVKK